MMCDRHAGSNRKRPPRGGSPSPGNRAAPARDVLRKDRSARARTRTSEVGARRATGYTTDLKSLRQELNPHLGRKFGRLHRHSRHSLSVGIASDAEGACLPLTLRRREVETAGVEPAPPRCKRGALPPELHPQVRTGGVEPPQREAAGLQPVELSRAQRPREPWGGRPDLNRYCGIHGPGCWPLHHGHHEAAGTTGLEPAASRLTSECSSQLSYAPRLR